MRFGLVESIYEKCLPTELYKAGLDTVPQVPLVMRYDGEMAGQFVTHVAVEYTVIIELKSVRRTALAHEIQLLNSGERKVEARRKVRESR